MSNPFHTHREIVQQGVVWKKVFNIMTEQEEALVRMLDGFRDDPAAEVVFTGAGSSFFVGQMVAGYFQKNTGITSRAVSTTEIVTHPRLYINPGRKVLLVSFARSGNSPESLAAIENAAHVNSRVMNLLITCNKDGDIIRRVDPGRRYVLLMPPETNDRGLAMTSSVTSMALAALLLSHAGQLTGFESQVTLASGYADHIIQNCSDELKKVAAMEFSRAVFLGSGSLMGSARESHLKLQEMTDGKVICKFDSFLAFRHGPKVVVNSETLVVYLFSNDPYVFQYERDLAVSVRKEQDPRFIIGISEHPLHVDVADLYITMGEGGTHLDEEFLAICSLIPAQLLGYYKSLDLGHNPDTPSSSGAIHRVVQGVVIYDFNEKSTLSNG